MDNANSLTGFYERLREWENYSEHLSFTDVNHCAYKAIVQMGMPVVPLLLGVLKYRKNPPRVFDMLSEITGASPVSPDNRGKIEKMRMDWVRWGKKEGHI